ncbi:MAG: hypothetical protein AAGG38_13950 [Planctomycetota bacterium]
MRAAGGLVDPLRPGVAGHLPGWRRFGLTMSLRAHREGRGVGEVPACRARYLEERLDEQMEGFFAKSQRASDRWTRAVGWMGQFFTWSAPVFIFLALLIKFGVFEAPGWLAGGWSLFFAYFLPIALPLLAGGMTSLMVAGDFRRRSERYKLIATRLKRSRRALQVVETESALGRTVAEIEEALTSELVEWYVAAKNAGH